MRGAEPKRHDRSIVWSTVECITSLRDGGTVATCAAMAYAELR